MRAVLCTAFGGPEGLRLVDRAQPVPERGQVAVSLRAWGLNYVDVLMVAGGYQLKPELPFVPGLEAAGTVSAVGAGVSGLSVGDRVMTRHRPGAFAEEVAIAATDALPVPAAMTLPEAACFRSAFTTAYHGLVQAGRLAPGERLLVHGAGGGMGLAAVQVGRCLGATVIATASTAEKRTAALREGASHALDHGRGFRDEIRAITHGQGVDVVFDPIGREVLEESMRCLNWGARLVVVGFTAGRPAVIATNRLLIKGATVTGIRAGEFSRRDPAQGARNLAVLLDWVAAGDIRPHISHRFPLERVADALQVIIERKVIGRVVLVRPEG